MAANCLAGLVAEDVTGFGAAAVELKLDGDIQSSKSRTQSNTRIACQ
jgi:hypothetical protein